MPQLPLDVIENSSVEEVKIKILSRKPFIIKNWDIGPCVHKWTYKYVASKVGNQLVKIHVCENSKMDFLNKNFLYKTLPFDELIQRIHMSEQREFFIHSKEVYYLRSLGNDPRGKDVANFLEQCPELAQDFKLPQFFDMNDLFSSVFRASSKGLELWTHYDVMDNILIQVSCYLYVIM